MPKRVRVTRLPQESKDLLARRKWTEFLQSLDVNRTYRVKIDNYYDKGMIYSVARAINKSRRKPKEVEVFDPPLDFSVYVHITQAPAEKVKASRQKIKGYYELRSEYFKRHKWKKLLTMLGVGEHIFKYKSVYDATKLQRWAWDANSRGRFDKIFQTKIDYENKRLAVVVRPRDP